MHNFIKKTNKNKHYDLLGLMSFVNCIGLFLLSKKFLFTQIT